MQSTTVPFNTLVFKPFALRRSVVMRRVCNRLYELFQTNMEVNELTFRLENMEIFWFDGRSGVRPN